MFKLKILFNNHIGIVFSDIENPETVDGLIIKFKILSISLLSDNEKRVYHKLSSKAILISYK